MIASTLIAQKNRDFSTDFIIRSASGSIAYLNCVTDVIIYLVQMKDFREFLRKRLPRSGDGHSHIIMYGETHLLMRARLCTELEKRTDLAQHFEKNTV